MGAKPCISFDLRGIGATLGILIPLGSLRLLNTDIYMLFAEFATLPPFRYTFNVNGHTFVLTICIKPQGVV